ncbi:MAG TPA: IclR family transcriptional regulator [Casimicrobiaceae bacterium]|nr:IclR family transcriptional regulator [Casimicrobiaceae bacterium]
MTRAVAILRLLSRAAEPMGVKAIAAALDLVPSTALHILRVLVDEGLARVDERKRYGLGNGLLALARTQLARNRFAVEVQPILDRVSRAWSVTAIGVDIESIDHMIVVALSRSQSPFRLHVDVGSRFPALISATGRLVAAFGNETAEEVERRFRKLRWQSPPDVSSWRREVETARRKRYAIDRGSYIAGVSVISVPVFDAHGKLAHSLVVAGVTSQIDAARAKAIVDDLTDEGRRLSEVVHTAS